MATLPLKASRNEQRYVICFLWAKGLRANANHFEMRPVIIFWANEENALWTEICICTEVQSTVRQWLRQQPASFFCVRHSETC